MAEASHVALKLLGPPVVEAAGASRAVLPRRLAGLLAYLAIEGPTRRERLAGLLWPDAPTSTARNNLSQSLRRLNQLVRNCEVVTGRECIQLGADVVADARRLIEAHRESAASDVVGSTGSLLGDLAFDDCDVYADWLLAARFRMDRLRAAECRRIADQAERRGDLAGAIVALERLVELEPYSEEGWRRLMSLLYASGERGGALAAYRRCLVVLEREVEAEPAEETQELAEQIRRDAPDRAPPIHERRLASRVPPQVMQPPRLVGREKLWVEMEEAWSRGAAILLSGPPGVGKTRLMREFLAAKGTPYLFEGRPDDTRIPYATHARTYRQMLEYFPALALPAWVEGEIARLLPERGPTPEREAVPLRFLQAQAEATRLAVEAGMLCVGVDDLQYVDEASLVAGYFVYSRYWGQSDGMRNVLAFREGALGADADAMLAHALGAEQAVLIRVEPLSDDAVNQLVRSLDVGLEPRSEELAWRSGGNPLFLLEMVRSLIQREESTRTSDRIALPPRVRELVSARLARLGPDARDLLRVAALAGERFGAGLAARVLGVPLIRLSEPWAELEDAQILRGERFAHDVVMEVARSEVPAELRDELLTGIDAAERATKAGV